MFEEILSNLFRIEVPLPNSPLKALNSYLIKGRDRSLIIDTGMNREECFQPMLSSLQKLDIDLNRADFFITHLHVDHLGLVGKLKAASSKIYFNETEASLMSAPSEEREKRYEEFFNLYLLNGFPEDQLKEALANHPGRRFSSGDPLHFSILKEADTINVGDYCFRCIETPGHSPGHMCLYEDKKRILISGDHILFDITPNITCWPDLQNPLKAYLSSLENVSVLEVNLVLPGHRSIWKNHKRRISELQQHHEKRLSEILFALKDGEKRAWDIASHISWDIDVSSWEFFPVAQKWFALGETLAHINYLEEDRKIQRESENNNIMYSLA